MENPIFCNYRSKNENSFLNTPHTHNTSIEILHVINGNGTIIIDDTLYPLTDNSIYFIKPLTLHHTAPNNCEKYLRSVANISFDYIENFSKITGFNDVLKSLFKNTPIILSIADSQYIDCKFDNLNSTSMAERSIALIKILNRLSKLNKTNDVIEGQIPEIISYINQNLSEKLTLDEISKNFHMSKYYLCHIFKEYTGMSLMSYILKQRISQAKNLMIYSRKSISEIALSVGFTSYSYFSRVFKESENISPRDFRRKYK